MATEPMPPVIIEANENTTAEVPIVQVKGDQMTDINMPGKQGLYGTHRGNVALMSEEAFNKPKINWWI